MNYRVISGDQWLEEHNDAKSQPNDNNSRFAISATPFVWRDPATIPPRQWLYGRHYIRKFVTCTIAVGGLGKTSLSIVEALAMASGKALLGVKPAQRLRVWLVNLEDPREEIERRVMAAMLHHQLTADDIAGHLFVNVGRETPIILATQTRNGVTIAVPVVEAMIATIRQNNIDAVIIDPFVKSHRVSENDNMAIDLVASQWGDIANVTDGGIDLLHHPKKTGGNEVTVEDGRGASALISASRSARVLNRMSKDEAAKLGVEADAAWRYFRVDNGKASMAPHAESADWYGLASVPLGNGDEVGVAVKWAKPDPFADVTVHDLRAAQRAVDEGGPWRANHQAKDWVGLPIGKALKLNMKGKAERQKVKALLEVWIANGMFVVVDGKDAERHTVQFVEVGTWADAT